MVWQKVKGMDEKRNALILERSDGKWYYLPLDKFRGNLNMNEIKTSLGKGKEISVDVNFDWFKITKIRIKDVERVVKKERLDIEDINLKTIFNMTPADLDEVFQRIYNEHLREIEPIRKELEDLQNAYREAPKRSKERRILKSKIAELKENLNKMEERFQEKVYDRGIKLREEIVNYLNERYELKKDADTEYTPIEQLTDEFMMAISDRPYIEKTWKMKIKDVLNLVAEEYVERGEIYPKFEREEEMEAD